MQLLKIGVEYLPTEIWQALKWHTSNYYNRANGQFILKNHFDTGIGVVPYCKAGY
jgi:hypothetical protein